SLLPRQTYNRLYAGGPDGMIAGGSQPAGTAEATDDGCWRVAGRWPFASGCLDADWMAGLCVMTEGGRRPAGPDGETTLIRGFFMPARGGQIEDTWHAGGLKATASHHIVMKDQVVPAAHFFDLDNGAPGLAGPLYQTVREVLPLFHGAFAVGM